MNRGTVLVGTAKHNLGLRVVVVRVDRDGRVYAHTEHSKRERRINPAFYEEANDA